MKLYLAIKWGNHVSDEGPSAPDDTWMIIRAGDHLQAAVQADTALMNAGWPGSVSAITEVAIDLATDGLPDVVVGPLIGRTRLTGYSISWQRGANGEWQRDDA